MRKRSSGKAELIEAIQVSLEKKKRVSSKRTLVGTFECGAYTWKEYSVPKDSKYLSEDSIDLEIHGICDCKRQEIYLAEGLPQPLRDEVRLHERVHAIFFSYFNSLDFHEVEEEIVTGVTRGIMQIKKSSKKA